ncbi:hypothetical protein ACROYT_G035597 [Oculina patagonica]
METIEDKPTKMGTLASQMMPMQRKNYTSASKEKPYCRHFCRAVYEVSPSTLRDCLLSNQWVAFENSVSPNHLPNDAPMKDVIKEPFATFLQNIDEQAQLVYEFVVLTSRKAVIEVDDDYWAMGLSEESEAEDSFERDPDWITLLDPKRSLIVDIFVRQFTNGYTLKYLAILIMKIKLEEEWFAQSNKAAKKAQDKQKESSEARMGRKAVIEVDDDYWAMGLSEESEAEDSFERDPDWITLLDPKRSLIVDIFVRQFTNGYTLKYLAILIMKIKLEEEWFAQSNKAAKKAQDKQKESSEARMGRKAVIEVDDDYWAMGLSEESEAEDSFERDPDWITLLDPKRSLIVDIFVRQFTNGYTLKYLAILIMKIKLEEEWFAQSNKAAKKAQDKKKESSEARMGRRAPDVIEVEDDYWAMGLSEESEAEDSFERDPDWNLIHIVTSQKFLSGSDYTSGSKEKPYCRHFCKAVYEVSPSTLRDCLLSNQWVAFENRVSPNHLPNDAPMKDVIKEPFATFLQNVDEQAQLVYEFVVLTSRKAVIEVEDDYWAMGLSEESEAEDSFERDPDWITLLDPKRSLIVDIFVRQFTNGYTLKYLAILIMKIKLEEEWFAQSNKAAKKAQDKQKESSEARMGRKAVIEVDDDYWAMGLSEESEAEDSFERDPDWNLIHIVTSQKFLSGSDYTSGSKEKPYCRHFCKAVYEVSPSTLRDCLLSNQWVAFENRVSPNHLPNDAPMKDVIKEPFATFLQNVDEQAQLVYEFVVLTPRKAVIEVDDDYWAMGLSEESEAEDSFERDPDWITLLNPKRSLIVDIFVRQFTNNTMFENFGKDFDHDLKVWKETMEKDAEKEKTLIARVKETGEDGNEEANTNAKVELQNHREAMHPGYSFTGGNVDIRCKPRQMAVKNRNKDYHMFQWVALENRVSPNHLPNNAPKKDVMKEPFTTFSLSQSQINISQSLKVERENVS